MFFQSWRKGVDAKLNVLTQKESKMASTLDDLTAGLAAEKTKTDALVAAFGSMQTNVASLQAQIVALQAGGTLSAADQAKLDAAVVAVNAISAEIDTALNPPAPAPTPAA